MNQWLVYFLLNKTVLQFVTFLHLFFDWQMPFKNRSEQRNPLNCLLQSLIEAATLGTIVAVVVVDGAHSSQ